MDLQFNFNQRTRLVTINLHGESNLATATDAFDQLISHPEFRPGMNAIWDLRQTSVTVRPGDPSKFAAYVRSRRGARGSRYRLAVLAKTTEQWSMARIFELVAATLPFEYRIFGDESAARQWQQFRPAAADTAPVIAAFQQMGRILRPQSV